MATLAPLSTPVTEEAPPGLLDGIDLGCAASEVMRRAAGEGVLHGDHVLHIDPVPRVFGAREWGVLTAGLVQRVNALEAFLHDIAGPRHVFADGVVPADLLDGNPWYEHAAATLPAPPVRIGVAGPDVVRDASGELVVLEDNVRTPTLQAYALAARRAVQRTLRSTTLQPRPIHAELLDLLRWLALAAAPDVDRPLVAILGNDPGNLVQWEIEELGRLTGWPVVGIADLRCRGDRVTLPDGRPVDVLWRRTSDELLGDVGRTLEPALRAGTLRILNAFGCAAADDKRTYPYVEDLVRYFCCEEPIVRSIPAYDLGNPEHRREALDRLGELVLKPRGGCGGRGVTLGPRATRSELESVRAAIDLQPSEWIAQELVALSTHPTVVDGVLEPRHVDLRPAIVAGPAGYGVLPGGLSRFAPAAGDLVVNCTQGGGGKDVWVLDD